MRRSTTAVVVAALAGTLLAAGGQAQAAPETSQDKRGVEIVAGAYKKLGKAGSGVAAAAAGQSGLVPLAPKRVLDTRDNGGAPIGQGATRILDLSADVPADATAVVLNLTGTDTTNNTFLTVWADELTQPEVSNINLNARSTRSNAATVAVLASRKVKIYNNGGTAHAILDLAGYYKLDAGDKYTPKAPERVLDTRSGAPVGPQGSVLIDFNGKVPADATAVTFNLTGINATGWTFVTAFPNGTDLPYVSNLNLNPNEITPNLVTVKLGADKKVNLYNNVGHVHLAADLAGYFAPSGSSWFYAVAPTRLVDTRIEPDLGPLDPSWVLVLNGFSADVKAVVGNLTGTQPTAGGYITAWPGGQAQPFVSNLNLAPGQTAANMMAVGVGVEPTFPNQSILFANQAGSVHVIFDWAGVYAD